MSIRPRLGQKVRVKGKIKYEYSRRVRNIGREDYEAEGIYCGARSIPVLREDDQLLDYGYTTVFIPVSGKQVYLVAVSERSIVKCLPEDVEVQGC